MLPFDLLQSVFAKLRFMDDSALKAVGLGKLAKGYDVYPVLEDGRKLYCLLPKGMDPAAARKMTPATATAIIVLQAQGKGLAKVWPVGNEAAQAAPAAPAAQAAPAAPAAKPAQPAPVAAAPKAAAPADDVGELEFVEE